MEERFPGAVSEEGEAAYREVVRRIFSEEEIGNISTTSGSIFVAALPQLALDLNPAK